MMKPVGDTLVGTVHMVNKLLPELVVFRNLYAHRAYNFGSTSKQLNYNNTYFMVNSTTPGATN
eukprot:5731815-Amphidinium_carterae.1